MLYTAIAPLLAVLLSASWTNAFAPPIVIQEVVVPETLSNGIAESSISSTSEWAKAALSSSSLNTAAASAAAKAPNTVPASTAKTTTRGIIISHIQYDGKVPKTEADEYVVISNNSQQQTDVSNYIIYVATSGTQGATFTFPKSTVLKAGQSVRVYTNEIHKESGGFSFASGKAIWNNKGGFAVLKDRKGGKLNEYKYVGVSPK
mmetsp:Transcript_29932/g.45352  ORF Transcript_29932/g.45352 Transcript_29932/m.45352 type:complete len:204 (+) Transcript_29932:158-769(+)